MKVMRFTSDIFRHAPQDVHQKPVNNQDLLSKWFRAALMTNGVDLLGTTSKRDRILVRFFLVWNIISNIYRIALNITLIVAGVSVFRDLLFIAIAACGIVAHMQLHRNRERINSTLRQMAVQMDPAEKQKLLSAQKKYAFMCFFATFSEVFRRCLLLANEGTRSTDN